MRQPAFSRPRCVVLAIAISLPVRCLISGMATSACPTPDLNPQENGVVVSSMVENMVTAAQTDEGEGGSLASRQNGHALLTVCAAPLDRNCHPMNPCTYSSTIARCCRHI